MQSIEEVRAKLKPINKFNLLMLKKEMKHLSEILQENEMIIVPAILAGMKYSNSLIVLTDMRLLVVYSDFNRNIYEIIYNRDAMKNMKTIYNFAKGRIVFEYDYEKELIEFGIVLDTAGKMFIDIFTQEFVVHEENKEFEQAHVVDSSKKAGEKNVHSGTISSNEDEKLSLKEIYKKTMAEYKLPKVHLKIINGKEELGFNGFLEMIQEVKGEVKFKVNGKVGEEIFIFHHFDRTQNIKKSDPLISTLAGGMWGRNAALGMGLSAISGTDKSTAALFLTNKETNKPIVLIVTCDSSILTKLSTFITAKQLNMPNFISSQSSVISSHKYEQLEKIGKLRDQGILTEEEFQVEKNKILN